MMRRKRGFVLAKVPSDRSKSVITSRSGKNHTGPMRIKWYKVALVDRSSFSIRFFVDESNQSMDLSNHREKSSTN